jgi:hypothetical protein
MMSKKENFEKIFKEITKGMSEYQKKLLIEKLFATLEARRR